MAKTSAKELLELYNQGLLACLPMKDITFLEVLKSKGLLPDDVRSSLEQIDETTERSSYFLEKMIKTGFDDGNDSHFTNLLAAMIESNHDIVKDLALEIQNKLDSNEDYNTVLDQCDQMEEGDNIPDIISTVKEIKSTSAKELLERYNQRLLTCLPMKDITFLEVLKGKGLLPDDVRSSLEQIDETTERSSYFLEKMVKTGFDDGNDSHFTNLLAAMIESSHNILKDLALEIQNKLLDVDSNEDYNTVLATEQEVEEVDGDLDVIPNEKTRDDKPVMSDLLTKVVHKQHAIHWKELGLKLGLTNDRMEIISYNNRHNPHRAQDCCTAMLQEWLQVVPLPTWGKLSDAINEIETGDEIEAGDGIEINTSVAYRTVDAMIRHYKVKYTDNNRFSTDDNYAFCETKVYIDPVFMVYQHKAKKTQAHSRKIAKIQFGGNIDETIYFSNVSKEKELNRIFEVTDKFIFIFEGAPGIGKTVVAKQIAYEWANNKILANIELLLLLYFRDPKLQNVRNFAELMQYCNVAPICKNHFSEKDGKNLMLLFDGYDELPKDATVHSLFKDLLERDTLSCCSIAFTSRPHNTIHLHHRCDRKIEILGFTENDRFNFLTKNNVPDDKTDKIRKLLQENLIINSLCYSPFNMASLLLLLTDTEDSQTDLPKTQTDLTRRAIGITISYHIRKSSKHVDIKKEDLKKQVKNTMDLLASLAFTMIKNEKLVFSETELNSAASKVLKINKNAFGLIQMVQFTNSEISTEIFYNFVHFSIQEYLAAYYLSQHFSIAQSFYLHYNFWDVRYFGIWKMYAGITQGKEFALQHFLSGENYLTGGFRFLTGHEFPGVSKDITVKKVNCLLLYQMFLEVPDSPVKESLSSVVTNDAIDLCSEMLSSCDVGLLTYCITRSYITMNWKMINLSQCSIGDGKCSRLFQGLSLDDGRQKPAIHCLDLSYNNITLEFSYENNVHGNSTVIHCLNISSNSITNFIVLDSLVKVHNITDLIICKNAQQIEHLEMLENNSMIKSLNLSCNNCWPTVQWTLPNLPNLRTLDMSHSHFEDDSIKMLQVHDNIFPSLQKLILSHCHIAGNGIAKLLCAIPKTVQLLDLSRTHIADDHGLTSLQEFFHHNDGLQELRLVATGLSGTNTLRCVQALKGCTKLRLLDISENDITDDEVESVIRLCWEIPSLKELKVKDILITEHILRHANKFSIRNYRDPIKRKILVIGMKNTGKSTLIRKLIKNSHHDASINPFRDTTQEPTTEIQLITKTLFINGKYYKCTFIDTPGLTHRTALDNIRQKLYSTDELMLIMFVFKHGESTTEAISLFCNLLEDVTCVKAAAVITFCDILSNVDYEEITKEFTSGSDTKQFSTDIDRRVYPIGFPNTAVMEEMAGELSRKFIQKNVSKLHQLIEVSSDCVPAKDVVRKRDKNCSIM